MKRLIFKLELKAAQVALPIMHGPDLNEGPFLAVVLSFLGLPLGLPERLHTQEEHIRHPLHAVQFARL